MNNANNIITTFERLYTVSDSLLSDCYHIANQTRPSEAMDIYYDLRRDVEQRGHVLFVCHGPRYPIGFIKGHFADDTMAKIDWFFVDSVYRGNGIGGRLLAMYVAACRERNMKSVALYSAPNRATLDFYRKNGFVQMAQNYNMVKSLVR